MSNFLDFIRNKHINEAFKADENLDKITGLISSLLKKHIDGLLPLTGYIETMSNNMTFLSKQYIVIKSPETVNMFQLNWIIGDDKTEVYSIDFFKNLDFAYSGKGKSDLTIFTLGSSVAYFLPIIWTVINSNNFSISKKDAESIGNSIYKNIKESYTYVGAVKYHILDNLSLKEIKEINEARSSADKEVSKLRWRKYGEMMIAGTEKDDSEEAMDKYKQIKREYDEITKAIQGGATTIDELKLALKDKINITIKPNKSEKEAEDEFKEAREDPEVVFKKMDKYIKMVIRGLTPSLIICGAPGVGKTHRVMTALKEARYVDGANLFVIKGKCSPRYLYTKLYDYKDNGDIIVIDDADGLVGPHAPEDCINILKGALDSTNTEDGRLVAYAVAGKLVDDEGMDIPKRFYYKGSIIIMTNWQAGSLDTALRGRSYIQDINFTVDELLLIIKRIMPGMSPEKYSMKSKVKAYDYLQQLANEKADMEISIRTFGLCTQIFESAANDPDFTDEEVRSMIREQMKLQSVRNKKKY